MLEIKNYFSDILQNISFKTNENLIILGANGAGKSTLAKVLSGIITSEHVTLFDRKITEITSKEKAALINYIPSKFEIFDEYMSVEEFLQLSFIDEEKSLQTILEMLELEKLKDHPCKTLSSGESQLLLLASAIAHDAKITILDEPTSNLDQMHIKQVFDLLRHKQVFQQQIIITHDLNFAYKLGFDILFIQEGKIAFKGNNETFFNESNLKTFFNGSVMKIQNHIVSNLS